MERVDVEDGHMNNPRIVLDDPADGLLGSLGTKKRCDLNGVLCPECGLVRTCEDLEE